MNGDREIEVAVSIEVPGGGSDSNRNLETRESVGCEPRGVSPEDSHGVGRVLADAGLLSTGRTSLIKLRQDNIRPLIVVEISNRDVSGREGRNPKRLGPRPLLRRD